MENNKFELDKKRFTPIGMCVCFSSNVLYTVNFVMKLIICDSILILIFNDI